MQIFDFFFQPESQLQYQRMMVLQKFLLMFFCHFSFESMSTIVFQIFTNNQSFCTIRFIMITHLFPFNLRWTILTAFDCVLNTLCINMCLNGDQRHHFSAQSTWFRPVLASCFMFRHIFSQACVRAIIVKIFTVYCSKTTLFLYMQLSEPSKDSGSALIEIFTLNWKIHTCLQMYWYILSSDYIWTVLTFQSQKLACFQMLIQLFIQQFKLAIFTWTENLLIWAKLIDMFLPEFSWYDLDTFFIFATQRKICAIFKMADFIEFLISEFAVLTDLINIFALNIVKILLISFKFFSTSIFNANHLSMRAIRFNMLVKKFSSNIVTTTVIGTSQGPFFTNLPMIFMLMSWRDKIAILTFYNNETTIIFQMFLKVLSVESRRTSIFGTFNILFRTQVFMLFILKEIFYGENILTTIRKIFATTLQIIYDHSRLFILPQ